MRRPMVVCLSALLLLPGAAGLRAQVVPAAAQQTVAPPAAGQSVPGRPLTLGDAFALADSQAFANRVAQAERDVSAAAGQASLRGILPGFRAELGWARSNDPLSVFGFTLRQRSVAAEDFDPVRLNDPAPRSNVGTALVLDVPLLNADAWLGRTAASRGVDAAEASADWARARTRFEVVQAYYGGALSHARVGALEAGHAAARSHVRRAESLLEQGLVTRSDVLVATVRAGEMETRLLEARGEAGLAGRRLATALGRPQEGDSTFAVPTRLPSADQVRQVAEPPAGPIPRADVEAARAAAAAARHDARRATALYLPRINSFARYDWNSASSVAGGQPAWTVGVMASWSPFSGGSELATRHETEARRQAAEAMAEAAAAAAALELRTRRQDLDVAVAALGIAEAAVAQAAEAHRIVTRKYEGGLATITELLESSALETNSRLGLEAAVYRTIIAAAALRVAMGQDLSDLVSLEGSNT